MFTFGFRKESETLTRPKENVFFDWLMMVYIQVLLRIQNILRNIIFRSLPFVWERCIAY